MSTFEEDPDQVHGLYHRDDPDTSREAARGIASKLNKLRAEVEEAYLRHPEGMTQEDLHTKYFSDLSYSSARSRVNELEKRGRLFKTGRVLQGKTYRNVYTHLKHLGPHMRVIHVSVQGLRVRIPAGMLNHELTAKQSVPRHGKRGRPRKSGPVEDTIHVPVYRNEPGLKFIEVGLGAIHFLARHPFLDIRYAREDPPRPALKPFVVPPGVMASPKWLVNGKERWYYHEALQKCRKAHTGCVKLPTGAGKTAIELSVAWNQADQIGCGVILVPTHTIKDQFMKAAEAFGIPVQDYRAWVKKPRVEGERVILITTPKVLQNDIEAVRMAKPDEFDDFRPILHKHQQLSWVIGDECHHAGCETWLQIFMGLTELRRSHGFSALPVEEATEGAMSFMQLSWEDAITVSTCGPIIYQKSTRELKDFLNIPTLINLEYEWPLEEEDQPNDDWHKLRSYVLKNESRHKLIANVVNWFVSQKRIIIVHTLERELTMAVVAACQSQRVVAWMGNDEIITAYRDRENFHDVWLDYTPDTLRELAGTEIFGLVCTSHAIEGLDLEKPISVTFMVEGQKVRSTIQKTGRAVRPGDLPSYVINLQDKGITVLPRHAKARAHAVLQEFDSPTVTVQSLDQLKATVAHLDSQSGNGRV